MIIARVLWSLAPNFFGSIATPNAPAEKNVLRSLGFDRFVPELLCLRHDDVFP
jgi:hypothetical protein